MIKHYTLETKPNFKDGDSIIVDMAVLAGGEGFRLGKVVGRGTIHIIDYWLVEFRNDFAPTYPFRVLSVPHTAFVISMPLDRMVEIVS